MDTQRLILAFVFVFSLVMLWTNWEKAQQPQAPATAISGGADPTLPSPTATTPSRENAASKVEAAPAGAQGTVVTVQTDTLRVEIDTLGGTVKRAQLLKHLGTVDPTKPFTLMDGNGTHRYMAQSGLIGPGLPDHRTAFGAAATEYALSEGQQEIVVKLTAPAATGVQVNKILTFHRGSYVVDVAWEVRNEGSQPLQADAFYQLVRDGEAPAGETTMVPTFTGVAAFTEADKFQKVAFSDIAKGKAKHTQFSSDGWIGIVQHYFLAAWLPKGNVKREFYTKALPGGLYSAGVILPLGPIATGATVVLDTPLYLGPQEQGKLADLAPGLDLTVDYGWLTVVATPLFWVLQWFHKWVGNWGVAIILLTVAIKAVFFPLSAASYKSMAKMRVVTPKLQKLREQYGDDRQRLHQAMMDLYKTEKINPLGGCLPIVVQIPVFIALYWVLLASVELRHAPFYFWIHDLSAKDPYYVLPIVMGITMIIQSRLNPVPPDPIQARMMQIMPIVFSVFFFFFPAGLVLYWLVNNVLSILQQWHITRTLGAEQAARSGKR